MRPLHPNLQRALALLDVPAPSFTGDDAAERLAVWKEEVLKPAWRRAAKKYHPDTATEADAALFQEAQEAYTMLLGVEIWKPPKPKPKPTPSPFASNDNSSGLDFKVGDPFGDRFGDPFGVPFGLGGRRRRHKTKINNNNGQGTAVPPPRRQPFPAPRRGVGRGTSEDMGGTAPNETALVGPGNGALGFGMRRHANGTVEVSLQMRLDDPAAAREVLAALSGLLHGGDGPPEAPPPDVNRRAAQNLRERFVVIGGKKGR